MTIKTVAATDVIAALGVNTHCNWSDMSGWAQGGPTILKCLEMIGAKVIRDAPPSGSVGAEYDSFFVGAGVRLLAVCNDGTGASEMPALVAFNQQYPGALYAVEGQNELDGAGVKPAQALANQAALYAAVRAQLPGVPTMSFSLTSSASPAAYAGAKCDMISFHPYANEMVKYNGGVLGGVPEPSMLANYQAFTAANPGAVLAQTEEGWSLGTDETWAQATDANRAIYTLRAWFYAIILGIPLICIYELMDNDSAGDSEDTFGLFDSQGNPRAAATAIKNVQGIIADTRAASVNQSAATIAGAADYALSMQKSDGSEVIVLWCFQGSAAESVTFPSARALSVYDPIEGKTVATASGTGISVTVPNYPVLVVARPAAVPAPIPAPTPTPTPQPVQPPVNESQPGAVLSGVHGYLIDASGGVWTLNAGGYGKYVLRNGQPAGFSAQVVALVWDGHAIWQTNGHGWWEWLGNTWVAGGGPAVMK